MKGENMNKTKKIAIIAVAVVMLAAALPVQADLYGKWAGTGKGYCFPNNSYSSIIYPWNVWEGEVYISPEQEAPIFEGVWVDELGNHGIFKGNVHFPPIEEIAVAEGAWYWFDPTGPANVPVYGGDFEMTFHFLEDYCKGIWTTHWPSPSEVGTMEGKYQD
jgi:hypothetical protein